MKVEPPSMNYLFKHRFVPVLLIASLSLVHAFMLFPTEIRTQTMSRNPTRIYKHYPTEGETFDVSEGPHHHLIDVDKESLRELALVNKKNSVQVHEMDVDAMNVMAACLATAIIFLFFVAAMDNDAITSALATWKNILQH